MWGVEQGTEKPLKAFRIVLMNPFSGLLQCFPLLTSPTSPTMIPLELRAICILHEIPPLTLLWESSIWTTLLSGLGSGHCGLMLETGRATLASNEISSVTRERNENSP